MPAPTGTELSVYKGSIKRSDIRARIEVSYPHVISSFDEEFATDGDFVTGAGADNYATKWYHFKPDGSRINVLGNLVLGVDPAVAPLGILRPASIWTKEGIVFPVDKTLPWTLEWRMRFNYAGTIDVLTTYLETAFRVCGIDNTRDIGGSICSIAGNQYLGTNICIPDGVVVGNLATSNTSMHTYTLSWNGSTYSLSWTPDGSGSHTLAGGVAGVIVRGADFISLGVQGITSNVPSIWTEMEVEYVKITSGSTESLVYPSWYSAVDNPFVDFASFSLLPSHSIVSGRVSVDKNNEVDAAELTLVGKDPAGTNKNIFNGFKFQNRRIVIESSQSDGVNSTTWKQIFVGVVDEQEYTIDDANGVQLSLRCRDINRRKLQRTLMTRAYADFTNSVVGIPNSYVVSAIMQDIMTQAGLTSTLSNPPDISGAGAVNNITTNAFIQGNVLKPKAINIIGQDGLSALSDLAGDVVYEIWVDHKNTMGKIFALPFVYTTGGTASYAFSVYDEVVLANYAPTTIGHVGQIELTFEAADESPFFAVYPVNRWPGDSTIQQKPSRLVQTWETVASTYPYHLDSWRRENRDVGSIEITAVGQDWLEMNLNVSCFDDIFLGITLGTIFQIDGWEYTWDEHEFMSKIRLIRRRPQDFLRSWL